MVLIAPTRRVAGGGDGGEGRGARVEDAHVVLVERRQVDDGADGGRANVLSAPTRRAAGGGDGGEGCHTVGRWAA
eukprot:3976447-Prymnesium_polylepis.3